MIIGRRRLDGSREVRVIGRKDRKGGDRTEEQKNRPWDGRTEEEAIGQNRIVAIGKKHTIAKKYCVVGVANKNVRIDRLKLKVNLR